MMSNKRQHDRVPLTFRFQQFIQSKLLERTLLNSKQLRSCSESEFNNRNIPLSLFLSYAVVCFYMSAAKRRHFAFVVFEFGQVSSAPEGFPRYTCGGVDP